MRLCSPSVFVHDVVWFCSINKKESTPQFYLYTYAIYSRCRTNPFTPLTQASHAADGVFLSAQPLARQHSAPALPARTVPDTSLAAPPAVLHSRQKEHVFGMPLRLQKPIKDTFFLYHVSPLTGADRWHARSFASKISRYLRSSFCFSMMIALH